MKFRKIRLMGLSALVVFASCQSTTDYYNPLDDFEQLDPATIFATPEPLPSPNYSPEQTQRGKYLVGLLGCGSCHTDGALVGAPDSSRLLAGSSTGIAYTSPFVDSNPGVVYPANLTPDMETGLGSWTMERLVTMIRVGTTEHSASSLPVMPWPAYANIEYDDALSIAAYLKSLRPVRHEVPRNVRRGQRAAAPYVHFGVYQTREQASEN
ncbi:MAG: cytochrome C [Proteobacteria bacterium]|nr:cytochrome C [Pseudomonadota bacterium]MDA0927637.1 cytochrome C [Pseudomonadota bacterium]